MRFILALAAAAFTFAAHAEKYEIFSTSYGYGRPSVSTSFVANRPLERAWVEVRVDTSDADSDLGDDTYEPLVQGLRYDPATKTIVLDRDGRIVECARFDRGSWLRTSGWRSTSCKLTHKLVKRPYDDGRRITQVDTVVVYLETVE